MKPKTLKPACYAFAEQLRDTGDEPAVAPPRPSASPTTPLGRLEGRGDGHRAGIVGQDVNAGEKLTFL